MKTVGMMSGFLLVLPAILIALLLSSATAAAQTPTLAPQAPVEGTPTPGSLESAVGTPYGNAG